MNKKVLFVDDSTAMRQMLDVAIGSAGYDVQTAVDGKDGLRQAAKQRFDVIIADINMPIMNGIDMVTALKKLDINKDTPVVMLTTEVDQNMKDKSSAAGAKAWVVKPFIPDKLIAVLNKLTKSLPIQH